MSGAEPRRVTALPLALLSGGLLFLAFPPADQGYLAFVAFVPLLAAAFGANPRSAALYGLTCGAAFFTLLLYWIAGVMTRYGNLPIAAAVPILALLVLYLSAFVAAFSALLAAAGARWGWRGLLLAPVFCVAMEILRARLLTGFPWGLVGYSQWSNVSLLQLSSLGGVYVSSFVVLLANTGLTLVILRRVPRPGRAAGILLLGFAAAAHAGGYGILRSLESRGACVASGSASIRVAAIQANVAQGLKWRRGEEDRIVGDLLEMTARAAREGADLIVWPESSSPLSFYRPAGPGGGAAMEIEPRRGFLDRVAETVSEGGFTLIAGSVDYHFEGEQLRATNSAFVIGPDGVPVASYDKVHLVPFGEYVPLRRLLFFVNRMVEGAIAEFAPGRDLRPLDTPAGEAATFVCYEAIFPELVRALARSADFMVNITNDAWFGRTAAPRQHLAMSVFRAPENRLWLVRAANTGISALIDPCGRVRASTGLEEQTILSGSIGPRAGVTLYSQAGDTFAWACVIVTALSVAALRAANRRPGPMGPGAAGAFDAT